MAELDACRITRGGLFLEPVHTEQMQRFARAYRALPARKFETVGASTDPVAVRTLTREGRGYLYLVNREYYPVTVELTLTSAAKVTDLASQETLHAQPLWRLTLGPYELRSFTLDGSVEVSGFTASAPPDIVAQLKNDAETALQQIERLRAASAVLPAGTERMAADIRVASRRRYAWLAGRPQLHIRSAAVSSLAGIGSAKREATARHALDFFDSR